VAGLAAATIVLGTGHHVPMVGVPFLADGTRSVPNTLNPFLIPSRLRRAGDRRDGFFAGLAIVRSNHDAGRRGSMGWILDPLPRPPRAALPEKAVVEAQLEVARAGRRLTRWRPPWKCPAAEPVALSRRHSLPLGRRFLRDPAAPGPSGKIELTFKQNPMMRWLWASIWIACGRRRGRAVASGAARAARRGNANGSASRALPAPAVCRQGGQSHFR